jgi:5-keto 4-deoxyuronate isomerase
MKEVPKTTEQIEAELKLELDTIASQHGVKKVFKIIVPFEGDTISAYFKKPDRIVIGATMAVEKRSPLKAKEMMLTACFLEGDRRILTDDDAFLSACTVIDEIVVIEQAELKKN